jgi:hypothetical protein
VQPQPEQPINLHLRMTIYVRLDYAPQLRVNRKSQIANLEGRQI